MTSHKTLVETFSHWRLHRSKGWHWTIKRGWPFGQSGHSFTLSLLAELCLSLFLCKRSRHDNRLFLWHLDRNGENARSTLCWRIGYSYFHVVLANLLVFGQFYAKLCFKKMLIELGSGHWGEDSIQPAPYLVLKLPRWRRGWMRSQSPKNENPTNKPSEPPKSETSEMKG